jgi:hypothetical protein
MVEQGAATSKGLAGVVRRHPWITAIFVVGTALGTLLGALFLPEEWALARRLAGGAVAGAGVGVFVTVTRLFE